MCLVGSPIGSAIPIGLDPGVATHRCLVRVDVPFVPLVGSTSLCRFGDCSSMCLRRYSHVSLPVCQSIKHDYSYVIGAVRLGFPSLSLQKSPRILVFAQASS